MVARYADSVKIMYGGKIVEEGDTFQIFENPHHPYTLGLIRAVPRLDLPRSHGLHTIEGEPPDMSRVPETCCAFHFRGKYATKECCTRRPSLEEVEPEMYIRDSTRSMWRRTPTACSSMCRKSFLPGIQTQILSILS